MSWPNLKALKAFFNEYWELKKSSFITICNVEMAISPTITLKWMNLFPFTNTLRQTISLSNCIKSIPSFDLRIVISENLVFLVFPVLRALVSLYIYIYCTQRNQTPTIPMFISNNSIKYHRYCTLTK